MERHQYFDLIVHNDAELEILLGRCIRKRETLHDWPLSCVQRLVFSDGSTLIYKASSGPTVEPEFYARVRSPLLVCTQTLYRDERYACMVLEDVKAPLLEQKELTEEEALRIGSDLLAGISQVEGSAPVYLDLSQWESWQAIMESMLQDLQGLVKNGQYQEVDGSSLTAIARCVSSRQVREAYHTPTGLVHNDLRGENIFILSDGYRVIDWQSPILGPTGIDLVRLLVSFGIDPRPYVLPGMIAITDLLLIRWCTECTLVWFPEGTQFYDRTIANLARKLT